MSIPLDGALMAQALSTKFCVSSDTDDGKLKGDHGKQTSEMTPGERRSPDRSALARARTGPSTTRITRPTSPTNRPRAARTWGPGGAALTRPTLVIRRQSPARLWRLSRSISPRQSFAANYRYSGLLNETIMYDAKSGAPIPGFQVNTIQSFSMNEPWPQEDSRITTQQPVHGMDSLEALIDTTHQGPADDAEEDDCGDSLLDEIDQPAEECPLLDRDHPFWEIEDQLVQHAHDRLAKSYPDLQKEAQKKQWKNVYACPFFHKNPTKYWTCLTDTTNTIQGVKRHLWRHHSQPYYCPVCYGIFTLASERDLHIKQRTCEKEEEVTRFDGMTPEQKALISSRCRDDSGPEQWRSIWKILFGRTADIIEPFLHPALAWNVMLVMEFWGAQGRDITEDFLSEMEMTKEGDACKDNDENSISGLMKVVLQGILELTFWGSALAYGNLPHPIA